MKTENDIYYGNAVNLGGLYSNKPIKCICDKEDNKAWDEESNFDIDINDLYKSRTGYISFASQNKHEVEIWTNGAIAVMKLLRQWSDTR